MILAASVHLWTHQNRLDVHADLHQDVPLFGFGLFLSVFTASTLSPEVLQRFSRTSELEVTGSSCGSDVMFRQQGAQASPTMTPSLPSFLSQG